MPFKSKSQARAAFGGYLGPIMKAKAAAWEDETPGGIKSLPQHAGKSSGIFTSRKPSAPPMKNSAMSGLAATRHRLKMDRADTMPKKGRR